MNDSEVAIGELEELDDPGCREFQVGEGDWPLHGFVVRQGDAVYAYENYCAHVGHPLNWMPDAFLTKDRSSIICASHGALYEIDSGLCFAGPCMGKSLRRVAVAVRDGTIFVTGR
jgi:nitrite reductase/ring-hydroxylating ferredoxin subunit